MTDCPCDFPSPLLFTHPIASATHISTQRFSRPPPSPTLPSSGPPNTTLRTAFLYLAKPFSTELQSKPILPLSVQYSPLPQGLTCIGSPPMMNPPTQAQAPSICTRSCSPLFNKCYPSSSSRLAKVPSPFFGTFHSQAHDTPPKYTNPISHKRCNAA